MNRRTLAFVFICLLVAIPTRGRAERYLSKELMMKTYSFHQEACANRDYAIDDPEIKLNPPKASAGIVAPGNVVIGFRWFNLGKGYFEDVFRGEVSRLEGGGAVIVKRDDKRWMIRTSDIFLIQVKQAELPPLDFTFTSTNWTLENGSEAEGKMQVSPENSNSLKIEAPPGRSVRSYNLNSLDGDFTATVMVEDNPADSPDEFGMVLIDGNASARELVRFSLSSPGHWRIVQGSGQENERKAEWKPLGKKTEAGKYQLVVKRVGTKYEMWVNDEKVGEVDLGMSAIVHPGLFVMAWKSGDGVAGGATVDFSEFNVVK